MRFHGVGSLAVVAFLCASTTLSLADDKKDGAGGAPKSPAATEPKPPADDPAQTDDVKKAQAARVRTVLAFLRGEKNRETVRKQIVAMGKSGDLADRDALMEFARGNSNQEFIDAAFTALVNYKTRPTFDFLLSKDALTGREFLVQIAAARSLGDMKHGYAVPALLTILDGKMTKIEVQGACLIALGKCGVAADTAKDAVMRYSAHKQDTVRANAIEAMGHLKTDDAYGRLLDRMANDSNARCRLAATTGLGILGRAEAGDALRTCAKGDQAQNVREGAIEALGKLGLKM